MNAGKLTESFVLTTYSIKVGPIVFLKIEWYLKEKPPTHMSRRLISDNYEQLPGLLLRTFEPVSPFKRSPPVDSITSFVTLLAMAFETS